MKLKKFIKNTAQLLRLNTVLNELNFQYNYLLNYRRNKRFKENNPSYPLPSNRNLFHTFKLNYELYAKDGNIAATEIIDWYDSHSSQNCNYLLDWGCGTARIIQYMPQVLPSAICYGADIDLKRIDWSRKQFPALFFDCIEYNHLPYPNFYFNLIYGISVFTHIHIQEFEYWLSELHRTLNKYGIAIVSTHGTNYYSQLSKKQLKILNNKGGFTNNYKEHGHLLMTTYNTALFFKKITQPYFEVKAFYEGKTHPDKLGGQDIWVLQKRES